MYQKYRNNLMLYPKRGVSKVPYFTLCPKRGVSKVLYFMICPKRGASKSSYLTLCPKRGVSRDKYIASSLTLLMKHVRGTTLASFISLPMRF